MMNYKTDRNFLLFWSSQSVSQLGSAMTSFALILWAYGRSGSALTVSLLTFFNYLPYILASFFAGALIDRHSKKRILLFADSAAALCTVLVLVAALSGRLVFWHIYFANALVGFMNAFQAPAEAVAIGRMLPTEKYRQASGLSSFSSSLSAIAAPMLAALVSAFAGLSGVILFDLATFAFAFVILLFKIHIPENGPQQSGPQPRFFSSCRMGFSFLYKDKGLARLIVGMALLNFFSRLTYENILSPMVLARSGENQFALGCVNAALGGGALLGGLIVSFKKFPGQDIKLLCGAAAFSFLCGDLIMGLGRSLPAWVFAGLAASLPIPLVTAAQNAILYRTVPPALQGRIFAARNAVQYCTIPCGILLGGLLADGLFEPLMRSGLPAAQALGQLVGHGPGSGMALMFLCTGILGAVTSFLLYQSPELQAL